jgi:hypothetical protein
VTPRFVRLLEVAFYAAALAGALQDWWSWGFATRLLLGYFGVRLLGYAVFTGGPYLLEAAYRRRLERERRAILRRLGNNSYRRDRP